MNLVKEVLWVEWQIDNFQPALRRITVTAIASALNVSLPYATQIRAGRCRPHPRHWEALANWCTTLYGPKPQRSSFENPACPDKLTQKGKMYRLMKKPLRLLRCAFQQCIARLNGSARAAWPGRTSFLQLRFNSFEGFLERGSCFVS